MAERTRVRAARDINYLEARAALESFLKHRATKSPVLRRLDRRGDPDGAYPVAGEPGMPAAVRHEMAGNFTAQAERRADRVSSDDLNPFPDWCWTGWETEMLRLPLLQNRVISLLLIDHCSQTETEQATCRGYKTVREALAEGLMTLVVNLLAVNPPPAR